MSVIGGLWKPTILINLLMGKKRFTELSRLIPDAIPRVLTQQLRELEADGMITRQVLPEVPPGWNTKPLTLRGRSHRSWGACAIREISFALTSRARASWSHTVPWKGHTPRR